MKIYEDNFAHNHLPIQELMPQFSFTGIDIEIPEMLNCVEFLLDKHIDQNNGQTIAIRTENETWTYQMLYDKANQIANALVDDFGLKSGNRVLIRSANNPMFVACWFAILKAGGIVVATMPLLREKELSEMIEIAEISHVICDFTLIEEVKNIKNELVKKIITFNGNNHLYENLEAVTATKDTFFSNFHTPSKAIALIGFTSGTTGKPKLTAHFHQDIVLICEAFPKFSLQPTPSDIFTGSPPLGFTFGLGGLVLFPFYYGASTFLIEKPTPEVLLQAIQNHQITICFTAPTAWRILASKAKEYNLTSLRKCVSAGETLPLKIWEDWFEATGLKIIDGIGSTEMLHIFISSNEENMKPGATGKAILGYEAKIIDTNGENVGANVPGKLAVRGITGCKYLNAPEKQKEYVQNGWNITGDIFKQDDEGYFYFVARGDDMIISSGYNIAAIEVENILLNHDNIKECAVVGLPNEDRGMVVCAYIVLFNSTLDNDSYCIEIQDWFKQNAAPYKYPRIIEFVKELPKTETGKIQRFKLKNKA